MAPSPRVHGSPLHSIPMTAMTASDPPDPPDPAREATRRREEAAAIVAAVAADIDGVAVRNTKALRQLAELDAEPNISVAVRRALERLGETAASLRRDGWLSPDQQRLL